VGAFVDLTKLQDDAVVTRYDGIRMIKQRTFTVDDLMLMDEAGLFHNQRIELLDGVIYDMTPTSPNHASTVNKLNREFSRWFIDRAIISIQNPIDVGNETWLPVPDVVIAKLGDYDNRHPTPNDILLLVEVSSTTLKNDLGIKLEKYAEAGIREYWIADLNTEEWIIHRDLAPGRYRSITRLSFTESVAPQVFLEDAQVWLS